MKMHESKDVLQEIRPSATDPVCQMLLLVIPCLPVNHKMANCKQNLDHDLRYRNFPRSRLRNRQLCLSLCGELEFT